MQDMLEYAPYLFFAIIIVVTILAFVISNRRIRARREGFSRQATLMGLTFAEELAAAEKRVLRRRDERARLHILKLVGTFSDAWASGIIATGHEQGRCSRRHGL